MLRESLDEVGEGKSDWIFVFGYSVDYVEWLQPFYAHMYVVLLNALSLREMNA